MSEQEKDPAAVALGRKGGTATYKKHGPEWYAAIGRKGGLRRMALDPGAAAEMGRKGGQAPKKR